MAATAAQLLAPAGDLLPEHFPGESTETITTRLEGYLAEGAVKAAPIADPDAAEEAAIAWAYGRAYQAMFVRLSGAPSSVDVKDEASSQFVIAQIQNFRAMAAEQRARFDALLAAAKETAVKPQPAVGGTTALVPIW